MGSCLGRCHLTRDISFSFYKLRYKRGESVDFESRRSNGSDIQDNNIESSLQENEDNDYPQVFAHIPKQSKFNRIKSIFTNLKNRHQNNSVRLELLDDAWSTSEVDFSAPFENVTPSRLPCAKVRSGKSVHSTPGNSLDLEWEHLPEMVVLTNLSEKEDQQKSATSASAWSRLSSPDSLEWDPVEGTINDEMDAETEQLLQEIEMLSSRTLRETQEWNS